MSASLKYVFVAVAVICCMQAVQMARLPRDAGGDSAPPTNILENISKPEFWNSLFNEENLKQLGIKPENIKDALNNAAGEIQKNFGELAKSLEGLADQHLANLPQKTN